MARPKKLPPEIRAAIRCGPVPVVRRYDLIVDHPQTLGERVVAFAHHYLITPEGMKVGQPLRLELFQIAFILAVFDNPSGTRHAYLSVGRRNGKTFIVAVIMLAYILGPLASENSHIASGAMARDQAALVYRLMEKMLMLSPKLDGYYRLVSSSKRILGLAQNVEYAALSREAKSGFGQSLRVILLDEAGQIVGATSDFVGMLTSSQGSYDDSLMLTISTQAASDADFLSIQMDSAELSQDPRTVVHLYTADKDCELMDKAQWKKANPGLGVFRSTRDLAEQLQDAVRIPSKEAAARNLLLNQRVAMESLWLAPSVWKANGGEVDMELFRTGKVAMGLDLSAKHDLTAAVFAVRDDDGIVHMLPLVFCPTRGIEDRSRRDRVPYAQWVRDGYLIPIGGDVMDYDQIFGFLRDWIDDNDIALCSIEFDRWRIDIAKRAAEDCSFPPCEWHQVGQGFKDFSPRVEAFEGLLLQQRIRHGNHPLLTMSASKAIAVSDPAGSKKLDKSKATTRIDPLVAGVMAVFAVTDGADLTEYEESPLLFL